MTTTDLCLSVEAYCVLCRRDLTLSGGRDVGNDEANDDEDDIWASNVLAFFDGAAATEGEQEEEDAREEKEENVCLHIFAQPNLHGSWPGVDGRPPWILRNGTDDAASWICVTFRARPSPFPCVNEDSNDGGGGNGHQKKHGALFFVHACCWQVVRTVGEVSFHQLYQLAQAIRPILPRGFFVNEYAAALTELAPFPNCSGWLREALALPVELQRMIVDHLQTGMAASLLRARQTALLLDRLSSSERSHQKVVLPFRGGGHLAATCVRLLGRSYLGRIALLDEPRGDAWEVSIAIRDTATITGARIHVGPLGVQGLTLVYADGSVSPCVGSGSMRDSFVQTLALDSTTSALVACRDDLKIFCIQSTGDVCDNNDPASPPAFPFPTRALWNPEPPADGDLAVIDTTRRPGRLLHYPGRRLCRFLPLQLGDRLATGLTVHCTARGIVGMTSHFGGDGLLTSEAQQHIGVPGGVPVHIVLKDGEHMQFLALRVPDREHPDVGPSLIVGTNRGQRVLCGPYGSSVARGTRSAVLATTGPVTGLFTDELTADDDGIWASIGASTMRGAPPGPPVLPPPDVRAAFPQAPSPREIDYENNKSSLSPLDSVFSSALIASKGVQTLHLRRQQEHGTDRVLGLCIRYRKGLVHTMGRWTPGYDNQDGTTTIETLYDASDDDSVNSGMISDMTFRFSADGTHVTDVVIGAAATGPHDVVVAIRAHLIRFVAWWYTETRDAVQPWRLVFFHLNFSEAATTADHPFRRRDVWRGDAAV